MRKKLWLSGAIAAALLVACTPGTEKPEAPATETASSSAMLDAYMAVADETLIVENAREADLTALVAALPDYATLSWDSKSLDAASGATAFENLSIGFGADPQFGLHFESAKVWGLETDLLAARLNGERLSDTGPLLTRLEADNVSYFGVAQAVNVLFDSIMRGIEEELPEGAELAFDEFESNTDRLVVTGVTLRPWELNPLPPERITDLDEDIPAEVVDFIHVAQQMVAVTRSISIDKNVSFGTRAHLKMRQPGAEWSADFQIGMVGADTVQGFDIGSYVTRDYSSTQINEYVHTPMPGEVISLSGFPAGFSMAQSESYGLSAVTDLRLDKVMGYLARSELPGMQERDLLSLGRWDITDYRAQLNEREIITADSAYFNADKFEWIIPSDLSFGMTGARLNTGELTGFFQVMFESLIDQSVSDELDDAEQAEMNMVREGIQKAIDLLPEHGLDTVPFDVEFSASWDAESGPSDFSAMFDADGFGRAEFDLALTLPIYSALQAASETEDKEAAFEDLFETMVAFNGGRYLEQDKGGYDKLFSFAHALGKEYPDQGWGAMLGSMEPAQLRSYLGTMMRMAKPGAAAEFPPAVDWIEAYASFLESGGTYEITSSPPQPVNKDLIEAYDDRDPDPEEIVEMLGLTVTHTK